MVSKFASIIIFPRAIILLATSRSIITQLNQQYILLFYYKSILLSVILFHVAKYVDCVLTCFILPLSLYYIADKIVAHHDISISP